jgi:hypothetical protein
MNREEIKNEAIRLRFMCNEEPHINSHPRGLLYAIYNYLFNCDETEEKPDKAKEDLVDFPTDENEEFIKVLDVYKRYGFGSPYCMGDLLRSSPLLFKQAGKREGKQYSVQPLRALVFIANNLRASHPKFARMARKVLEDLKKNG